MVTIQAIGEMMNEVAKLRSLMEDHQQCETEGHKLTLSVRARWWAKIVFRFADVPLVAFIGWHTLRLLPVHWSFSISVK